MLLTMLLPLVGQYLLRRLYNNWRGPQWRLFICAVVAISFVSSCLCGKIIGCFSEKDSDLAFWIRPPTRNKPWSSRNGFSDNIFEFSLWIELIAKDFCYGISTNSWNWLETVIWSLIKIGPCHHKSYDINFSGDIPHDIKSAGLLLDATWYQCSLYVKFLIRESRLETNVFHLDGHPFIHASVMVKSLQKYFFSNLILVISHIQFVNSARSVAANNYKRGNVTLLTGAIHDFAVINWIFTVSSFISDFI